MPIVLLLFGGLILTSAIKGTEHQLGNQLSSDFTGSGSFLAWIAALGAIGCVGYIPYMQQPSRYMLALLLVVMLFSNQGFFTQFAQAIQGGVTPDASVSYSAAAAATGNATSSSGSSSGTSSASPFDLGGLLDLGALATGL